MVVWAHRWYFPDADGILQDWCKSLAEEEKEREKDEEGGPLSDNTVIAGDRI